MAVQLMTNVKLWSTVTKGGGDTVIIGDPDSNFLDRPPRYKASLTASCLVAHVLAVVLAVALEGVRRPGPVEAAARLVAAAERVRAGLDGGLIGWLCVYARFLT